MLKASAKERGDTQRLESYIAALSGNLALDLLPLVDAFWYNPWQQHIPRYAKPARDSTPVVLRLCEYGHGSYFWHISGGSCAAHQSANRQVRVLF